MISPGIVATVAIFAFCSLIVYIFFRTKHELSGKQITLVYVGGWVTERLRDSVFDYMGWSITEELLRLLGF
jgi:hypothetical protein